MEDIIKSELKRKNELVKTEFPVLVDNLKNLGFKKWMKQLSVQEYHFDNGVEVLVRIWPEDKWYVSKHAAFDISYQNKRMTIAPKLTGEIVEKLTRDKWQQFGQQLIEQHNLLQKVDFGQSNQFVKQAKKTIKTNLIS